MTGSQLRSLREKRGLTRDALAEWLGGCSAPAIVKWERDERPIPSWVEEKMISNVPVTLPIKDLRLLLDHAARTGQTFDQLIAQAARQIIETQSQNGQIIESSHEFQPPPFAGSAEQSLRAAQESAALIQRGKDFKYPTPKPKSSRLNDEPAKGR